MCGARALARARATQKLYPMKMSRLRKIVSGTVGSEIAEAALVLPIFFMIMLGIYWFGRAFNVYATINHAAREGARVAAAQTCATCGTRRHWSAAPIDSRGSSQASPASFQPRSRSSHNLLAPPRTACAEVERRAVKSQRGRQSSICVYYNVQLPTYFARDSGTPDCGVSVQFQYPYQFSLPFTSLNMQKIMLNAGVQMTGEY